MALVAVLLVVFVCLLATGDPVEMLVPPDATDADKARIRHAYGLDRPLLYQFGAFVWRAAQGDFGRSFFSDRPALVSGCALLAIGFGIGRIGREARHADLPAEVAAPVAATAPV